MDVAVAHGGHRAEREVERVRPRAEVAIWPGLASSSRKNEREKHITSRTRSIAIAWGLLLASSRRRCPSSDHHRPADEPQPGKREREAADVAPRAVEVEREREVRDQHSHEGQDRSIPALALPVMPTAPPADRSPTEPTHLASGSISTRTALKKQAHRDGQERAERAEHPGPEDQGQEGEGGRQTHGVAHDAWAG